MDAANNTADTLTKARAIEILTAAGDRAEATIGIRAGWESCLDKVMTASERAAVTRVWKTLPGHYSFSRTLTRIARGR